MATSDDDPALDDSVLAEVARGLAAPAVEGWTAGVPPEQRYQLGETLGTGGMATVRAATDTVLGRAVALKFVRDANPVLVARLQREARAQARIDHPNICRVYDVGELDGAPFIAMQRIDGRPLGAVGPTLTIPERVRIVRDVALAVHAAHAAGLVHRDLKPANVLVDTDGKPYVMDFGIAREASDTTLTLTGQVIGTPQYMAPEQATGKADAVDARTDVYALGATLYELVCGVPPFAAPTLAELIVQIASADPVPPRKRVPGLPVALDTIIMRCLAKRGDARYPSARAFADELDRFLAGAPIEARPPGLAARAVAAVRRHRLRAAVAVAGVATATAIAIGVHASRDHAARPAWRPVIRELPQFEENSTYATFSPDGTRLAYDSDRDGRFRIYTSALDGSDERAVTGPDAAARFPRFAADGRVLYRDEDQTNAVLAVGADAGAPVMIVPGPLVNTFARCGDALVIVRQNVPCPSCVALLLRAPDGTERELVHRPTGVSITGPSCDRDGRRVAFSLGSTLVPSSAVDREIWVVDVASGRERRVVERGGNLSPSLHPDGTSVVFASQRGGATNLWEQPLAGGEAEQLTFGAGRDLAPEVAPDGRTLVFDVDTTSIPLFEIAAGGTPRRLTPTLDNIARVAVTTDGEHVVFEHDHGATRTVVVRAVRTGEERVLGDGGNPALGPGDREVVWSRGHQIVAAPIGGGTERVIGSFPGEVFQLAVDADGAIHAEVALTDGLQAWQMSPTGTPAVELADRELVQPARIGGWRLAIAGRTGEVIAPDRQPGDPANPRLVVDFAYWEADGASLLYQHEDDVVRRYWVATGTDEVALRLHMARDFATTADRKTFYVAQRIGRVRRQLITNYGDRPRP